MSDIVISFVYSRKNILFTKSARVYLNFVLTRFIWKITTLLLLLYFLMIFASKAFILLMFKQVCVMLILFETP